MAGVLGRTPEGRTWRYTQFCEYYKAFARTLKRSMRQRRRAGEKLFIDFAGSTVGLADGTRAQVFVSAMAASSCVFACATLAQRLDDWIDAMVRALRGKTLWLRATDTAVSVYHEHQLVASHRRAQRKGERVSVRLPLAARSTALLRP